MNLLKQLCNVPATAGDEGLLRDFLWKFVKTNEKNWRVKPKIHQGNFLQDNLILEFGKPRTAAFAHMDSVGFTVGYYNQLIPIGSPQVRTGDTLVGEDRLGPITCTVVVSEESVITYEFPRAIARGTVLVYQCNFRSSEDYVESCYLDNRLGVYNLLKIAPELENGLLVFTCREEHGGGAIPMLAKYIYETFSITQTLISDITWVTAGVRHGDGVAISLRDQGIPRKNYLDRILLLAEESGVQYQLEVESSGSSDARELQASPYPFDWCFIGAPEGGVHSPNEKVHHDDIKDMINLYKYLLRNL